MPDSAYWQDIVSVYRGGVNYYLNSNHRPIRSISRKMCVRLFNYALQNSDHSFANLVAPPTDGTEKCLVRCKVHLVL